MDGSTDSPYSATFLAAVDLLLKDEGVHSNSSGDRGGDTWYGISRKQYPDIAWPPIREQAIDIYWRDWWKFFAYGLVRPEIAPKLLILAVDMGPDDAGRCLQRAVRACGVNIAEDGIVGDGTRAAVNSCADVQALLAAFRSEAAGWYRTQFAAEAAKGQKADAEFIKGWLNRAYQ